MLQNLSIQNYALIESLNIDFNKGLSTITGETGAGKSLLLGALGLIIGNRTDTSVIKGSEKKCIIEASFNIEAYDLQSFFEANDVDFENETVVRREILASGKSRAFVNDTPVNLSFLQKLGKFLIDIHSQHQTIELTQSDFQFYILDAVANTKKELASFKRGLKKHKKALSNLNELIENQEKLKETYDYNSFLFNELKEANLRDDEQEELEGLLEKLSNSEEIQERLVMVNQTIISENLGVSDQLNSIKQQLGKISGISSEYQELYERIESISIELDDINTNLETQLEFVDSDPEKLNYTNDRLQLIYSLQKKHQVVTIKELLTVQDQLDEKVSVSENIEDAISEAQGKVNDIEDKLNIVADKIHSKREKALPKFTKNIEKILAELGMPNASFNPILERVEAFNNYGANYFDLEFCANKGGNYGPLKKVASGGELSRIMLAVKMLLSKHTKLPTIIFDEIDTGVSGEVAQKMALLLFEMGENQQVFSITHLPQIAAKGENQYKVYKEDINDITQTQLKQLSEKQRIEEIAEMIGGKQLTQAALAHASTLLGN